MRVPVVAQQAERQRVDRPPHLRRRELPEPRAAAHDRPEQPRPPARRDEAARVVARDRVDLALPDPEEPAHPVDRRAGRVDEVAVADDEDALGVDVAVQVRQLLAVPPELAVAPEGRPAGADPLVLATERRHEVRLRLEAVGPQVHPVAVGAVHRVADDGDETHVGQVLGDAAVGAAAPQVERRALAAHLVLGRRGEEREVAVGAPDPLLLRVLVARPPPGRRRRAVAQPVLRFLRVRHEDVRVLRERGVERRRTGLGGADHEEVGAWCSGHGPSRG